MSKRKSKLKAMAEAGDQWAIETLARMRAQGRAAGLHGATMRMARDPDPEAEAARDIREWTDGRRPTPWRVHRLAQALKNG